MEDNWMDQATAYLSGIDPMTIIKAFLYLCVGYIAYFLFRTVVTAACRAFGIYHPNQDRLWLRLPWRAPFLLYMHVKRWHERTFVMNTQSSGGLAGFLSGLAQRYKPGMFFLGRAYAFGMPLLQPIGLKRLERHGFLIAQTGGGKTTQLITMISCWAGSAFIVDPKNQITARLAPYDKRKWYIFDPKKEFGYESVCINVLDFMIWAIKENGLEAGVEWAIRIASSLIKVPEGNRSPFFYESPQGFMVGIILHVYTYHGEEYCNLPYIRDLIKTGYRITNESTGGIESTADEEFEILLEAMRNNDSLDQLIPGAAAVFCSAGKETLGNVKATLFQQTAWLDIPFIRDSTRNSTFDLRELKTRDDVVFSFVAPVLSLRKSLAPLARLVIEATTYAFEEVKEQNGRCLMVVDELPSLGHIEVIEVALPVLRDYGLSFLGISQSLELLQKAYPKTWRSFLANADFVMWIACSELTETKYISEVLGKTQIKEQDPNTGQIIKRVGNVRDPEQIERLLEPGSGRALITRPGKRSMLAVTDPYHTALPVNAYSAAPDHKEAFLRQITRNILGLSEAPELKSKNTPQAPSKTNAILEEDL